MTLTCCRTSGAEVHQDHGQGVVGRGVEQTLASGGVTAGLLLVSTFYWWRQRWRRTRTLALLDKLGEWRQDPQRAGVGAQLLGPTLSTMGREFDRHHLPSWRPEPPFLPGRIAEPVEAPGARSGLPILQQPQAKAGQPGGPTGLLRPVIRCRYRASR
jgi:hypothetical protein